MNGAKSEEETRSLANTLHKERNRAKYSMKTAADHLDCSSAKISRMESGTRSINALDAYTLLRFYGLDREEASKISGHDASSQARPLEVFDNDIPPWLRPYLEYESRADTVDHYQRDMIPGIMQTPEYAQLVAGTWSVNGGMLTRDLQLRRQQSFLESPTVMTMVVDEAVLHRMELSDQQRAEQLDYLLRMAEHPRINLSLLPMTVSPHHLTVSFTCFMLSSPKQPQMITCTRQAHEVTYNTSPAHFRQYQDTFALLLQDCLAKEETIQRIRNIRDHLGVMQQPDSGLVEHSSN